VFVKFKTQAAPSRQQQVTIVDFELTVHQFPEIEDLIVGKEFHLARVWSGGDEVYVQIMEPMWTNRDTIAGGGLRDATPL